MRFAGLVAAALCIAAFSAGCSQSSKSGPYWVKGLDLPAGSTDVDVMGDDPGSSVLTVAFTNPSGWAAVRGHFDTALTAQGFTDATDQINSMMGEAAPADAGSYSRMYTKGGPLKKQVVMITDMEAMMSSGPGHHASNPKMQQALQAVAGSFSLTVTLP